MPTYAYYCSQCGSEYERRESFDAPSEHACPQCQGVARRRIVLPAVVFKGSGFYSTDNRRSSGWNGDSDGASKDGSTATAGASSHSHDHGDASHGDHDHDF